MKWFNDKKIGFGSRIQLTDSIQSQHSKRMKIKMKIHIIYLIVNDLSMHCFFLSYLKNV